MSSVPSTGPNASDGGSAPAIRRVTRRELFRFGHAPEDGHWIRIHRPAMACRFEILLDGADEPNAAAAREALDEADRLEAELSVFRETSTLSRVNQTAAETPVAVDADLFGLLTRCRDLYARTGGAFDITSTPLSRCWGFLKREGRLPSPEAIAAARAVVGMSGVLFDETARTVRFARAGMELNLGSIGKRYALDCMAALIRGREQRRRPRGSRRGMDGRRALAADRGRQARPPLPARRRPGHERGGRAVLRGGWKALRPRHRPTHGMAGGGRAERERRDRGGRAQRCAVHGVPRGRARRRPALLRVASADTRSRDPRRWHV